MMKVIYLLLCLVSLPLLRSVSILFNLKNDVVVERAPAEEPRRKKISLRSTASSRVETKPLPPPQVQNNRALPENIKPIIPPLSVDKTPIMTKISEKETITKVSSSSVFSLPPPEFHKKNLSPVKNVLKVYVYDNLPKELGEDVEEFLYNQFTNSATAGADWKSELALIELFRSFPGRTFNPEEADIFVVPYAHVGHCWMTPGEEKYGCGHVKRTAMKELFNSLTYYDQHKNRHLFFLGGGTFLSHKKLDRQPLVLTTGPRTKIDRPGAIVISQFNDDPSFQPFQILSKPEEWWTRPRKYAFSYLFGESNAQLQFLVGGRHLRTHFRQDMEAHCNNATIGGLPFQLRAMIKDNTGSNGMATQNHGSDSYEDSIFCPILAGDAGWQRKFFDAILSACLPVVLAWQTPQHPGGKSWTAPDIQSSQGQTITFSVQQTHPFAKGVASPDVEIDYESFVVECPGNPNNESDVASLRQTMEDLLLNKPEEIKRRQLAMKKVALSFTFGLGGDAHRYEDEFARIIRSLRSYVDHLT